ncbi:MAG TPA: GNAT family N-acetyltransferase [Rhodanobacteraceae bacterium]|nr:GNAT family N-acetyltransferase [Rhodanobacteraceae bacterium]
MTLQVSHDPGKHAFTVEVEGYTGTLDYDLRGTTMTITHTLVPEAIGGRGVAAELTRVALETARANGWKVVPMCSYAVAYLRRHPEYNDLLLGQVGKGA